MTMMSRNSGCLRLSRKEWLLVGAAVLAMAMFAVSGAAATTSQTTLTSETSPTSTSAISSRSLQEGSDTTFRNPRAPSRRTPDDVPEPNSIPQSELQALLLLQNENNRINATANREKDQADGNGGNGGDPRRRFLMAVIFIPTICLVLGTFVLFRAKKHFRNSGSNTETEGLFQTQNDKEFVAQENLQEQPPPPPPKQSSSYHDSVSDEGSFAEIRKNVI